MKGLESTKTILQKKKEYNLLYTRKINEEELRRTLLEGKFRG